MPHPDYVVAPEELEGLPHELYLEDRQGRVKTLLLDFLKGLD